MKRPGAGKKVKAAHFAFNPIDKTGKSILKSRKPINGKKNKEAT